jgi:Tfp pilus assembly protein PilF/peroxiredoxin
LEDDGRGAGRVDWDLDGDLDLWITNRNGPQVRFLRNCLTNNNQFLAVRLKGSTCNRDAIGARVEVVLAGNNGPRLVKSLCAGDGYLSQSSKWMHFGLGKASRIDRLIVHWPDGVREELAGVEPGQRYTVRQGSGRAELFTPDVGHVDLVQSDVAPGPAPGNIAVLSVSNVPVPRLPYRTLDGQAREVFEPASGQPVLLNLWASWCQPCLTELEEFVTHKDQVMSAGLDVVALSVDAIGPQNTADTEAPRNVLRRIKFPFRNGEADSGLVEKLQLLNNHLFDLHLPLPLPTSFLIDGDGQLAALYKGEVSIERVLRDVAMIGQDIETRRRASVPFDGRWYEPPQRISLIPLLDALTAGGFLNEADDYVRRLGEARKEHLLPAIVRLGMSFYERAEWEKAKEHFSAATRIDPRFVGVEIALGVKREQEGRAESAQKLYREALRRNPTSVPALNNLARLLATHPEEKIRNGSEAVKLARQAAEQTNFSQVTILATLADALAASGDFRQASAVAMQALQLSRSRGQLSMAKALEDRLKLFERRQPMKAR